MSQAGLKDGPAPSWWTHGEIEIGGRDFVNDPRVGGSTEGNTIVGSGAGQTVGMVHLGQQSLAKYYEYSIIAPGAFGGGHVATGSNDGLYQLDFWANNAGSNFAGFSDQSYLLEASKASEHYFSFAWDQTPHIYSTSAMTPFLGVGTSNLTLPSALVTTPITTSFGAGGPTQPSGAKLGVVPYLHEFDLGIQRDTASFAYRWTPTEAWDFGANYSHMDRTGTQAFGVENSYSSPIQVPAPVNDTTQNFGANGEYLGKNLWGQYTFKAAYSGSIYTDNLSTSYGPASFTVQNPFFPTTGTGSFCPGGTAKSTTAAGTASCGSMLESTPPSNEANSVTATGTADLPLKSRYVGTVSFSEMDQNAAFLPMTNNYYASNSPFNGGGYSWNSPLGLPAQSLNGQIDTILSNNTITTKITPELTSKLNYRYYDFDNQTPQITFPCWVSQDGTGLAPPVGGYTSAHPCGGTAVQASAPSGLEGSISSLSISYIKQNASEELNWRPDKEWNFNASGGWEGYTYKEADAGATDEFFGKASVDWKPASWLTWRATGYYSDRTEEDYSYLKNVAAIQFPTVGNYYTTGSSWYYQPAYQQFMFDNRQRTKADLVTDIVVFPGVTLSPSLKYQDDHYGVNPTYQEGINNSTMLSAGADLVYVPRPDLSFAFSYYWEDYYTLLFSTNGNNPTTAANQITTTDREHVNTYVAAVNYAAIPNKLNFDLRASVSDGIDKQRCSQCVGASGVAGAPFPNDTTLDERVDASATYKFDPALVGFGDMKFKLRYTWERNAVSNWQNDPLAPFTSTISAPQALWMGYDNPNFNIQMVTASVIVKW